jgi:hypothetical protein
MRVATLVIIKISKGSSPKKKKIFFLTIFTLRITSTGSTTISNYHQYEWEGKIGLKRENYPSIS